MLEQEQTTNPLDYHATSFSQGRMNFTWQDLTEEERQQAYANWEAGKGLIGGDPRRRPYADRLPDWGIHSRFFRTLALNDTRSDFNPLLKQELASARPLEIEIGFGRGDFLLDRAERFPQRLFIGYETKTKATRLFLQRMEQRGLSNVWVSDDDARFSLPRVLDDGRIESLHVLFPDPWWKEQHQVKRLFSPPFVDLLAAKIGVNGMLFFKSDVAEYGELVRYLVEQHPAFGDHDSTLSARIGDYAPTHREFWCIRNNKSVHSYYFQHS